MRIAGLSTRVDGVREDRWLQPEEALTDTLRCYVCDEPLEYDDDWPPAPIRCTCEDESEEETEEA